MIITLKPHTEEEQKDQLMRWLSGRGLEVDVSEEDDHELLRLIGDTSVVDVSMVEMLNATVIIRVIPALVRMVLNSFVMARFDIPSKEGTMLRRKLTGRNMA